MNRKGFTLVELLAVIAILAILVIIALPNVMGMFNDAKKSSFTTECKRIYKIAEQKFINDSMYEQKERVYAKCNGCTQEKLDMSGRDNINYYIKIDKSGKVVEFYVSDDTYQFGYEDEDTGNGLLPTSIEDSKEIATIPESEVIEITDEGVSHGKLGNPIVVCEYSQFNKETNSIGMTNHDCYSKQTVKECLGANYSYLYNNEESNPTSNIRYCYTHWQDYCTTFWSCINSECSNNSSFYKSVSSDDLVLPSSKGCYSIRHFYVECLDGDTEIEVYDKKKKKKYKKKLKDITYDDLILCYDFDKGEYTYERPLWIMNPNEGVRSIVLSFDNNTVLKVVGDHRIFDYDKGLFVRASELEVGSRTYTSDGKIVRLSDKRVINEPNTAYNVITYKHINMFANNILTSQGSNNIYKIENMKFVKEEREHFSDKELSSINSEYVEGLRLKEWDILDKGSKEETLIDLNNYIDNLKNNKKS